MIGQPAYAGIGSRETPEPHLRAMREWARRLAGAGYLLRSGAADGADSAFEAGALEAGGPTEIWLPWDGFNGHLTGVAADRMSAYGRACRLAEAHHPGWARLSKGPRALMARNVFQVLGRDLQSPVRFVLCWAPKPRYGSDGRILDVFGGTGLAVRLAASHGIPVCHLDYHVSLRELEQLLEAESAPTF